MSGVKWYMGYYSVNDCRVIQYIVWCILYSVYDLMETVQQFLSMTPMYLRDKVVDPNAKASSLLKATVEPFFITDQSFH